MQPQDTTLISLPAIPTYLREYVPAPLSPSPDTAVCAVCHLDRDAAIDEGWTIAALPVAMRSREQQAQVQLVISLLDSCERNCAAAGGWAVAS